MNNSIKLFLLLALLSFLVSCASSDYEAPTFDELLNSTCPAPCWFGVTPGETSKEELVELIPQFPYYLKNHVLWMDDQYTSSSSVPNTSNSTFTLIVGKNWAGIEVRIMDYTVSSILISSILDESFKYNDLKFTLDDAIRLYGNPSDVYLDTGCLNKCQNVFVVFSEKNTLVMVETQDLSLNVEFLPTLPVRNVAFFKHFSSRDSLAHLTNIGECNLLPFRLAWKGYTTLSFPYRLQECY